MKMRISFVLATLVLGTVLLLPLSWLKPEVQAQVGGSTTGQMKSAQTVGWSSAVDGSAAADISMGRSAAKKWAVATSAALTNPAMVVDQSAASAVTGLAITSSAAGSGLTMALQGGNTDEAINLQAKGNSTVNVLGSSGSGAVTLSVQRTDLTSRKLDLYSDAGGFQRINSSNAFIVDAASGTALLRLRGSGMSVTDSGNTDDIGFARAAAGVLRISNAAAGDGIIRVGNGSSTTPGYSFNNSTNTGWVLRDTSGYVTFYAQGSSKSEQNTVGFEVLNTGSYTFSGDGTAFGTADGGIMRVAANVIRPSAGIAGNGWLQQTAGRARLTANVTNATATMSNLTDLTLPQGGGNLATTRKYAGILTLVAKNSTAAEGVQIDFNGGTATWTDFQANIIATPPGVTLGVTTSTAIATALTATTATTTDVAYTIHWCGTVNVAGTFIPRVAEVSHTSGTVTAEKNSWIWTEDMPN